MCLIVIKNIKKYLYKMVMSKIKISKIQVVYLFGVYDYDLECASNSDVDNLMILYGDNGTGKSTILRMIYYLLSSKSNCGHKSQLANIPFKDFKIHFDDGSFVEAVRMSTSTNLLGTYSILYKIGDVADHFDLVARKDDDDHWVIRDQDSLNDEKFDSFLDRLHNLNILYITDTRKVQDFDDQTTIETYRINRIKARMRRMEKGATDVDNAIRSLHDWIINRALSANKKGEEGTSDIYAKIIEQLSKTQKSDNGKTSLEKIKENLTDISIRVKPYVDMGFLSESDYRNLLKNISNTKSRKIEIVNAVLTPYIEMLNNKIKALDSLMEIISYLLKSLSGYLHEKIISFSINEGLVIRHRKNGEIVQPSSLSSGEKQLLILFSQVIVKSSECSLILIDEPEISLNVKWQRMLMDTMNFFVGKNHAQFIIATHSFEILSRHIGNVAKLVDKTEYE